MDHWSNSMLIYLIKIDRAENMPTLFMLFSELKNKDFYFLWRSFLLKWH